jgi:hypothetical protein
MSTISYRCHSCGTTHELEHIRKNLYYGQRAIGDVQAFQRGGALSLGKRVVRRKVTRTLMRGLWGN